MRKEMYPFTLIGVLQHNTVYNLKALVKQIIFGWIFVYNMNG